MVINKTYLIYCTFFSIEVFLLFYNVHQYDPPHRRLQRFILLKSKLDLKFILVWTSSKRDVMMDLGENVKSFIDRNCFVFNCYASSNRKLLKDVADFDAVVFYGQDLIDDPAALPKSRSVHQKYIFANIESSGNYPISHPMFNSYFNWTWTYKLNSDEYFGYISIRNKEGKVIGPREEMHWKKVEEMQPINETMKKILSRKKVAAAWFVSHCNSPSGRDIIATQLEIALAAHNLTIDVYGRCGPYKCPPENMADCWYKLERDYYFYLAFENMLSEDYVTEKLLHALKHYAVPVVYGGANYTRFMPDGIYLDIRKQSIKMLAKTMANIIKDKEKYYTFFKWHNHYSYHDVIESPQTDPYCKLCAMLHDKQKFQRISIYDQFTKWWNYPKFS